ncbi:MAG: CDGSH iron-sulfur domain-containing protein [Gammaproteobacteria bacterium]|nr:CDGSH iron-sulfur domain-containing protein [Gammaproteobacteria bacterium]
MSEPDCPQKSPYPVQMEAGTYFWCACGKSSKQPFCDGSHKGSEFTPVKVELAEAGKQFWCGCKRSGKGAMCDGTHKTL